MINVFRKIWLFSGEEKGNLKKSIIAAFFHAIFNSFQFVAIYYMLEYLFISQISTKNIIIAFVILMISLLGKNCNTKHFSNETNSCRLFYGS